MLSAVCSASHHLRSRADICRMCMRRRVADRERQDGTGWARRGFCDIPDRRQPFLMGTGRTERHRGWSGMLPLQENPINLSSVQFGFNFCDKFKEGMRFQQLVSVLSMFENLTGIARVRVAEILLAAPAVTLVARRAGSASV
jgi:hypothetical protein